MKRGKAALIWLVFFLLFISCSLAESMNVSIYLDEENEMVQKVVFYSEGGGVLEFEPHGMELVNSSDECKQDEEGVVRCKVNDTVTLYFKGNAEELGFIEKTSHGRKFSVGFMSLNASTRITLHLPKGASVVKINNVNQIFPEPTAYSDLERIVLEWQDANKVFVEYSLPSESEWLWAGVLLALVGLAIGVGLGMTVRRRKRKKLLERVLREEEEKVVETLRENNGEMLQTKLCESLGFSSPKLSKILRRLEEMEIVERVPKGRKNLVKLKE